MQQGAGKRVIVGDEGQRVVGGAFGKEGGQGGRGAGMGGGGGEGGVVRK